MYLGPSNVAIAVLDTGNIMMDKLNRSQNLGIFIVFQTIKFYFTH